MQTEEAIKHLKGYLDNRQPVGDFLTAVLENNLVNAVIRADSTSLLNLKAIIMWVYWDMPSNAWGSTEAVERWLRPQRSAPTLNEWRERVEVQFHCTSTPLPVDIEHYDHEWGWPVDGYKDLQWLYLTCPYCGDQVALWKLGVPRPVPGLGDTT
jgi:hypothetical protein